MKLQEFDLTVRYKKGEENLVADCFSRCIHISHVYMWAVSPMWPEYVQKLKELYLIPCMICGSPREMTTLSIVTVAEGLSILDVSCSKGQLYRVVLGLPRM